MNKVGIICQDEIEVVGNCKYNNYRLALQYYLLCKLVDVKSVDDLDGLDVLFIIDECHIRHIHVWKNINFINAVNDKNIKVIVFNFTRIYRSVLPWKTDTQDFLNQFKKITQFVGDVDDAKVLKQTVINKCFMSKQTVLPVDDFDITNKQGTIYLGSHSMFMGRRDRLIEKMEKAFDKNVFITDHKLSYKDYICKINRYKFIICPLSTNKCIGFRFYEALKLNSIPVQEIREDMRPWYPELEACVPYNFPADLNPRMLVVVDNSQKYNNYYLEDYFNDISLINYLNG